MPVVTLWKMVCGWVWYCLCYCHCCTYKYCMQEYQYVSSTVSKAKPLHCEYAVEMTCDKFKFKNVTQEYKVTVTMDYCKLPKSPHDTGMQVECCNDSSSNDNNHTVCFKLAWEMRFCLLNVLYVPIPRKFTTISGILIVVQWNSLNNPFWQLQTIAG